MAVAFVACEDSNPPKPLSDYDKVEIKLYQTERFDYEKQKSIKDETCKSGVKEACKVGVAMMAGSYDPNLLAKLEKDSRTEIQKIIDDFFSRHKDSDGRTPCENLAAQNDKQDNKTSEKCREFAYFIYNVGKDSYFSRWKNNPFTWFYEKIAENNAILCEKQDDALACIRAIEIYTNFYGPDVVRLIIRNEKKLESLANKAIALATNRLEYARADSTKSTLDSQSIADNEAFALMILSRVYPRMMSMTEFEFRDKEWSIEKAKDCQKCREKEDFYKHTEESAFKQGLLDIGFCLGDKNCTKEGTTHATLEAQIAEITAELKEQKIKYANQVQNYKKYFNEGCNIGLTRLCKDIKYIDNYVKEYILKFGEEKED